MKLLTTILFIFASTLAYSQDGAAANVFHKVLTEEISKEDAYIRCDKPKTYFNFNKSGFNEQTGLSVPMEVLQGLEESAFKSSEGKWDTAVIQSITDYFLNSTDCIT